MSSKSKEVRMEQRRILEKKLELRLQKLAGQGISKEKTAKDPLVKNLKSQIRETNIRMATFDKNTLKINQLAQAKEAKLAAKLLPKEPKAAPAAPEKEPKAKKKAAPAAADGEAPKKPRKKKEELKAE